jgi:hypothetical protein
MVFCRASGHLIVSIILSTLQKWTEIVSVLRVFPVHAIESPHSNCQERKEIDHTVAELEFSTLSFSCDSEDA